MLNNQIKIKNINEEKKKNFLKTTNKINYTNNFIYLDKSEFKIVWFNVFMFIILHFYYLKAIYNLINLDYEFVKCAPLTFIWTLWGALGVTAGAHRLWSHKSYSAKLPLQIFLMLGQVISGQNNLYVWIRDHRVHHKYSETDADPHNSLRGFFFAHMGWLLHKKHPDILIKGQFIDLCDLKSNSIIQFQVKYYYYLFFIVNFALPVYLIVVLFNASIYSAILYGFFLRYCSSLHSAWFVNSAAHMFGHKPYNIKIRPVENIYVSLGTIGEGYHNYHHTYPWDYSASEYSKFNITKSFIDLMNKLGLAYNLKRAPESLVKKSKLKIQTNLKYTNN